MRLGQVRGLYLVLVGIQVVTSLAGIALLGRMSPAIGEILTTNEASVEHAEVMLGALALGDAQSFEDALRRAEREVTEPGERVIIARVRSRAGGALAGDRGARFDTVSELMRLVEINRESMHAADAAARRLGLAGRWALALLALIGLLASAWAMRKARIQLVAPLTELVAVLQARAAGDRHRRCTRSGDAELGRILTELNEIIDAAESAVQPREREGGPARAALAPLLDAMGGALVVVDAEGELVAASQDAIDRLAERGAAIRPALRAGELERRPLGGSGLLLVAIGDA